MNKEPSANAQVLYHGLDDRPPAAQACMLALQHVLTMFGATVSIPLLIGPAMGMTPEQIGVLVSAVMLCNGIATLLQATFGSRLPIVQGVSFSFVAAFIGIIAAVTDRGGSPADVMQYIAGAIMIGAAVELVIGFSGLMGWIRRFLSPVVVGPVIMLIGLALFQHGAPKAGTDWLVSGVTIILIILMSLVLSRRSRYFQMFPILAAIAIVVISCWLCSLAGFYQPGDASYVDLTAAASSPWLRLDARVFAFPWGIPRFDVGFAVAVLAGYLASMIESVGDYHACSQIANAGEPTPRQISRGIGFEGIGCLLAGVFGGLPTTSYSENIGLVGLTKVASRYVVQIAAVILIFLGFLGKFGALAAAIPGPVVGGLYCAMFGLISTVGVRELAKCDLHSDRNLFIAGFSLFMGLSVPAYFSSVATTDGMLAGQTLAIYTPTASELLNQLNSGLQSIILSIGSTGMAVAAILGTVLDNLIPGSRKERGLPSEPV